MFIVRARARCASGVVEDQMRKQIVRDATEVDRDYHWLDLPHLASVEVTSEDPRFPVESVFADLPASRGWRAADTGVQTIRLRFDTPIRLQRIWLRFVEAEHERTHEFRLRWSKQGEPELREIIRQQWNFSPQGSTQEVEDYPVHLTGVAVLELTIQPGQNGAALASLDSWRVG
jgi:hypothetical protein